MKILLTNDDGYTAPGIRALYDRLRKTHEVTLVAPDGERSAVGHGITIHSPLVMKEIRNGVSAREYAVSGTPADCVKLALFDLFEVPPDLVISGINAGSNTGINIHYSGTVGAAREAALNGVPAMAASIKIGDVMDFVGMAQIMEKVVCMVRLEQLKQGTFLNINAPAGDLGAVRGIKTTCQSMTNLATEFEKRDDPRGRPYFWYGRMPRINGSGQATDDEAVNAGYISMTPLQCDITDYDMVETLALDVREATGMNVL